MQYLEIVFDENDREKVETFLEETMNNAEKKGLVVEAGSVHGELSVEQKLQLLKEELDAVTNEIRGVEVEDVEDQDSPGNP